MDNMDNMEKYPLRSLIMTSNNIEDPIWKIWQLKRLLLKPSPMPD
jgi:hypothetical protein